MYLNRKILSRTIPLKTIISKSIADLKIANQVCIVDVGNAYSHTTFTSTMYSNSFESRPCFVSAKYAVFKDEKQTHNL